mmetsp:Transcript_7922/g.23448  ORF Transcript_7922/g.23448 Transcript_7922/m.23448 type:complete len:321 (+) Transcript_7922:4101-5063(+)
MLKPPSHRTITCRIDLQAISTFQTFRWGREHTISTNMREGHPILLRPKCLVIIRACIITANSKSGSFHHSLLALWPTRQCLWLLKNSVPQLHPCLCIDDAHILQRFLPVVHAVTRGPLPSLLLFQVEVLGIGARGHGGARYEVMSLPVANRLIHQPYRLGVRHRPLDLIQCQGLFLLLGRRRQCSGHRILLRGLHPSGAVDASHPDSSDLHRLLDATPGGSVLHILGRGNEQFKLLADEAVHFRQVEEVPGVGQWTAAAVIFLGAGSYIRNSPIICQRLLFARPLVARVGTSDSVIASFVFREGDRRGHRRANNKSVHPQ